MGPKLSLFWGPDSLRNGRLNAEEEEDEEEKGGNFSHTTLPSLGLWCEIRQRSMSNHNEKCFLGNKIKSRAKFLQKHFEMHVNYVVRTSSPLKLSKKSTVGLGAGAKRGIGEKGWRKKSFAARCGKRGRERERKRGEKERKRKSKFFLVFFQGRREKEKV